MISRNLWNSRAFLGRKEIEESARISNCPKNRADQKFSNIPFPGAYKNHIRLHNETVYFSRECGLQRTAQSASFSRILLQPDFLLPNGNGCRKNSTETEVKLTLVFREEGWHQCPDNRLNGMAFPLKTSTSFVSGRCQRTKSFEVAFAGWTDFRFRLRL